MKYILLILTIILLGLTMRSTPSKCLRKIGVFVYLAAFIVTIYIITECPICSVSCFLVFILIPWFELFFFARKKRFPQSNRITKHSLPESSCFPELENILKALHSHKFTALTEGGWQCGDSYEHYHFLWNEEKKLITIISNRIDTHVCFSYLKIFSIHENGTLYQTTNYPFPEDLIPTPDLIKNQITGCDAASPDFLLHSHENFLFENEVHPHFLQPLSKDSILALTEKLSKTQLLFNEKCGIIKKTPCHNYSYTLKGLAYLWRQTLLELIRFK